MSDGSDAQNDPPRCGSQCEVPSYDVRLITLRGHDEGTLPSYSELTETEWQYLVGRLDPAPGVAATVCVWEIRAARWLLPPEYLSEFRSRMLDGGRSLLAAHFRDSPELDEQYRRVSLFDTNRSPMVKYEDCAWRLERHWLVEWSDLKAGARRPPVAFLGEDAHPVLLGADLPPRLRIASAALAVFDFVTADEIRSVFRSLHEPEPSASDLSRVLAYFVESGWLVEAPEHVASAYRRDRAVGRRPLRVFLSVLSDAFWWTGSERQLGIWEVFDRRGPSIACSDGHTSECGLRRGGTPGILAAMRLQEWSDTITRLRQRGLRTV